MLVANLAWWFCSDTTDTTFFSFAFDECRHTESKAHDTYFAVCTMLMNANPN